MTHTSNLGITHDRHGGPYLDVLDTLTVHASSENNVSAGWHDDTHRYHIWLQGVDNGNVIHCNSLAPDPARPWVHKHTTRDPRAATNAPLIARVRRLVKDGNLIAKAQEERLAREAEEEEKRRGAVIERLRGEAFSLGFNLVPFEKDAQ